MWVLLDQLLDNPPNTQDLVLDISSNGIKLDGNLEYSKYCSACWFPVGVNLVTGN